MLLLDLNMPVMNGFEVMEHLNRDEQPEEFEKLIEQELAIERS